MYRLIGVGGFIRGKKFDLHEGVNIIGRGEHSNVVLNFDGISKKHFQITLHNNAIALEDLGSSNGTFVNEKLVSQKYLEIGDIISVPGAILRLVKAKDKMENNVQENQADLPNYSGVETIEEVWESNKNKGDQTFIDKFKYIFKVKLMKIVYEFNLSYEWHSILVFSIFSFVVINNLLTIGPILEDSRKLLISELKDRGRQYVEEVERTNAGILSRMEIDNVNDSSLKSSSSDIQSYLIFDASGRIIRPVDKLNTYVNDSFSVGLMEWVKQKQENSNKVYTRNINDQAIGVGKAITVMNLDNQRENVVGYVSLVFKPKTLTEAAMSNKIAYIESLIISCFAAIFFIALIYYLTTRHIEELNLQIELMQKGKMKEIKNSYLMSELIPLKKNMNSVLQRFKELSFNDGSMVEHEGEETYVEALHSVLKCVKSSALVLDSARNIKFLNESAEELLGLRETMSQGSSVLDTLRDQGLAATIVDLCDQSSNNHGVVQIAAYEIKGVMYNISVMSLIGKDSFAKGFFVGFVIHES